MSESEYESLSEFSESEETKEEEEEETKEEKETKAWEEMKAWEDIFGESDVEEEEIFEAVTRAQRFAKQESEELSNIEELRFRFLERKQKNLTNKRNSIKRGLFKKIKKKRGGQKWSDENIRNEKTDELIKELKIIQKELDVLESEWYALGENGPQIQELHEEYIELLKNKPLNEKEIVKVINRAIKLGVLQILTFQRIKEEEIFELQKEYENLSEKLAISGGKPISKQREINEEMKDLLVRIGEVQRQFPRPPITQIEEEEFFPQEFERIFEPQETLRKIQFDFNKAIKNVYSGKKARKVLETKNSKLNNNQRDVLVSYIYAVIVKINEKICLIELTNDEVMDYANTIFDQISAKSDTIGDLIIFIAKIFGIIDLKRLGNYLPATLQRFHLKLFSDFGVLKDSDLLWEIWSYFPEERDRLNNIIKSNQIYLSRFLVVKVYEISDPTIRKPRLVIPSNNLERFKITHEICSVCINCSELVNDEQFQWNIVVYNDDGNIKCYMLNEIAERLSQNNFNIPEDEEKEFDDDFREYINCFNCEEISDAFKLMSTSQGVCITVSERVASALSEEEEKEEGVSKEEEILPLLLADFPFIEHMLQQLGEWETQMITDVNIEDENQKKETCDYCKKNMSRPIRTIRGYDAPQVVAFCNTNCLAKMGPQEEEKEILEEEEEKEILEEEILKEEEEKEILEEEELRKFERRVKRMQDIYRETKFMREIGVPIGEIETEIPSL